MWFSYLLIDFVLIKKNLKDRTERYKGIKNQNTRSRFKQLSLLGIIYKTLEMNLSKNWRLQCFQTKMVSRLLPVWDVMVWVIAQKT